jgi:hypothetical protein
MKITGYLSEFSMAEIFRFLEQGHKTGCLSIKPVEDPNEIPAFPLADEYYIFFNHGNIAAATTTLDHQGLQRLLEKRGWLRSTTVKKILPLCPVNISMGLCLKSQGAIDAEHLQLLFKQQVLSPIPQLFSIKEGLFKFDDQHPLPHWEMTGLSASPMEITLAGLRLLRDWVPLIDKLPLSTSTIVSTVQGKPPYHLNAVEWQVWEHINGDLSIANIAKATNLPVLEAQKICFRLMVIGVAEEVAGISEPSTNKTEQEPEKTELSQSFLDGLLNFLKSKKG